MKRLLTFANVLGAATIIIALSLYLPEPKALAQAVNHYVAATFHPSATAAGLAVECTTLPSSPANGAVACDSGAGNVVKFYSGGAWVTTESGGGSYTKVQREYYFFPATQNSGGTGLQGNLVSPSSGGATVDTLGTAPYRLGRLGGFVDGSTISVSGALLIPAGWDGGTVTADIGYSQGSGGSAAQVVRWRIATACVGAGEDESAPTRNTADAVNSTIASATANTHTLASFSSLTMTGCAASELFTFVLDREGGNASDTLTATAYMDSLRITFLVNLQ